MAGIIKTFSFLSTSAEKYHEQIHIEHNSTGHSYERLLGRFLDEQLTEVVVEDPYVRTTHQVQFQSKFKLEGSFSL